MTTERKYWWQKWKNSVKISPKTQKEKQNKGDRKHKDLEISQAHFLP